jgi:bifunctional non-homologous end joining protein LigD
VALKTYWKKRKFDVTSEPRGKPAKKQGFRFVIQKHAATRLHYDLRLELDGVMKSWAVTKGPSLVPGEKRLAVHVEDHPIEYNAFEGTIPKGQYGGGTVMIWDRGQWTPEGDPHRGYQKGHLDFSLQGEKLHGSWHLIRMRRRENERQDPWLLIKARDEAAREPGEPDILEQETRSVMTKRSLEEIAAGRPARKRAPPKTSATAKAGTTKPSAAKRLSTARKRTSSTAKKGTAKRTVRAAAVAADAVRSPARRRSRGLPAFIPPCLALLEAQPPADSGWVHEIKFDGYRLQAHIDGGRVKLLTRRGLDWTAKFQRIADALAELSCDNAILDGEVVVENERGISDFSSLQADLSAGRDDRMRYYLFDCLYLDGSELSKLPLVARKQALENLLRGQSDTLHYSAHVEEPGAAVLKSACNLQLEGIISKRRDAPYHSGRTGDWIKTKCSDRQEFVIAGYTPSTVSSAMIGALAVGYYENGTFRYAGRIGTGYDQKMARDLMKRLKPLAAARPPFETVPAEERRRRDVVWVKPELVIEADFRGWTADRILRHASFKGVRGDKKATDVVREVPAAMPAQMPARIQTENSVTARRGVQARAGSRKSVKGGKPLKGVKADERRPVSLTHPDRVYWKDVGVTKQDLADYWSRVWDLAEPHIVRRPLALLRCPDGAGGQCFVQKHAHATFNQGNLLRFHDGKEEIIAVDSLDGITALVQAGVLEVHVWGSLIDAVDLCDRLVFDLDPGPGVKWPDVINATKDLRARLDQLGLESFVKTTGGKGFHVVVPIAGEGWDVVKPFTKALAEAVAADEPGRYVSKMTKSIRGGKIFVDYLRNGRGATAVAAYSPRARNGAPVSAPIAWSELTPKLTADQFTIVNFKQRLSRQKKDPWADIGRVKQKLPPISALKKL